MVREHDPNHLATLMFYYISGQTRSVMSGRNSLV